jgi:glutaconyl-CoA/methylmalonyl-CoA decarboxylase subunit delta
MVQNLALGVALTVAGMGLVFALLAVLWLLMTILLRLDSRGDKAKRRQGDAAQETVTVVPALSSPNASELSPEMLAAVMVAVRMHRRVRRKQAAPAMRSHQPGALPSRWIGAGRASQNQNWHPGRR